jgi:hypothetical protein
MTVEAVRLLPSIWLDGIFVILAQKVSLTLIEAETSGLGIEIEPLRKAFGRALA